jgi:hypothetical protein
MQRRSLGAVSARLSDVVEVLDGMFPPSWAQSWTRSGWWRATRTPSWHRVLLAVDPVEPVAEEAVDGRLRPAAHPPPALAARHDVRRRDTPEGPARAPARHGGLRAVRRPHQRRRRRPRRVRRAGRTLGLTDLRPLQPIAADPLDKLVVFVPSDDADRLLDALADAVRGAVGDYERCAWTTTGTGTFRPLPGRRPAIGSVGDVEQVAETRLEVVLPRARAPACCARCSRRTPTRSRRTTCSSSPPSSARAGSAGSASCRRR